MENTWRSLKNKQVGTVTNRQLEYLENLYEDVWVTMESIVLLTDELIVMDEIHGEVRIGLSGLSNWVHDTIGELGVEQEVVVEELTKLRRYTKHYIGFGLYIKREIVESDVTTDVAKTTSEMCKHMDRIVELLDYLTPVQPKYTVSTTADILPEKRTTYGDIIQRIEDSRTEILREAVHEDGIKARTLSLIEVAYVQVESTLVKEIGNRPY